MGNNVDASNKEVAIMLVLTRRAGEEIRIGDDIRIVVSRVRGNQVRIGIEAPPYTRISRPKSKRRKSTDFVTNYSTSEPVEV